MKKQLSMSLAGLMAFGAVVPAFANEINTLALQANEEVNVRLANGKEIYSDANGKEVFKRYEIFNYNGANAQDRDKHTLKSEYSHLEVLVKQENAKDANEDLFVLSKESENAIEVATNKAKYDAIMKEINVLLEDGYQINKSTTKATVSYIDGYVTGTEVVELVKAGSETKIITFNNVDLLDVVTIDEVEALRDKVFKNILPQIDELIGTDVNYDEITQKITINFDTINEEVNVYKASNLLKYVIENNVDKFDIVVDDSGTGNTGKLVKLYMKNASKENKNIVMSIEFSNIAKLNESKIVDMPLLNNTDFNGHWAEDTIVDAMLNGYIDSADNFRPKDSVTRAEFAKMVCNIFGIENVEGNQEPFHDVKEDAWYYDYVTALYNVGGKGVVIDGYEDSTFKPNNSISRQEAAKMIASAYSIKGGILPLVEVNIDGEAKLQPTTTATLNGVIEKTETINGQIIHLDSLTSFSDDSDIKSWADASVENLKELSIIQGYEDKSFKPNNSISRVEALLMLSRGQELLK